MRICTWIIVLLCLCGCDRRDLTYVEDYTTAEITVRADWSLANLDYEKDYGSTVIFYPQDGRGHKLTLMGDRTVETVRLEPGLYDAVLFNRSLTDFGGVAFRGHESLETFEAYATKTETRGGEPPHEVITASPERIAVAVVHDFEVTEDMIGNYGRASSGRDVSCLLELTPQEVTRSLQVKVNMQGVKNVRSAKCAIVGVPSSLFLHNGTSGGTSVTQEFSLGSAVLYPGSGKNGYMESTVNVFGFDAGREHEIRIEALLVDGTTVVSQTLTGITVTEKDNGNGVIGLYIEAVAPEVMPDVKPEGSEESGFDVDVSDWDKEEHEDIIM